MSDDAAHDAKQKLAAQMREFPQTMEMMQRIRDAMAAQVFLTKLGDVTIRENLFLRVQTLDAMMSQMAELLRLGADEKLIEAHIKSLTATTGE